VFEIEKKYQNKKGFKWLGLIIGAALWGVLGYYIVELCHYLFNSEYNRSGIESICLTYFAETNIFEALAAEIFIVSVEINSYTPFIFSKYTAT